MSTPHRFTDVLDFWFSEQAEPLWFEKNDDFDAAIRRHLGPIQKAAHAGEMDDWIETPRGALALTVLLDQAPRNLYRGTPEAFASDPKARDVARAVLARGYDQRFACPRQRAFLYLPFEHSEDMADQDLSVRLFRAHGTARHVEFAEAHRDVIRQFGRFPHRNKALGRANTPAEEDYLKDPDAGW